MTYILIKSETFAYHKGSNGEWICIRRYEYNISDCIPFYTWRAESIVCAGLKDVVRKQQLRAHQAFMETLAMHIANTRTEKATYLFESTWKRPYSDREVRKVLQKYTEEAGIEHSISSHKLLHFLFTWMKKKGVDDTLIQPYSGRESRKLLEIYSKLSLNDCQEKYENTIKAFSV